ncbi:MAG TPA: YidC/Oxa1 family membrane protein insertase [Trebonia sp.]|jgi:YidC/Oxa1 family membrane protein insertase|nr:YidC/Oxa1 family membrane protein insertase [Trebonia sp.]
MSGFLGVPVGAAYHLVFALTQLLIAVPGGLGAAAAVVLFTAAVRLAISPLSFRALRGQAATARLAPRVQSLRTRYRREPERLQRELAALYKREGASPFAGLLPLLAQWPLLSVLYLLFRSATVDGQPNQLLSGRLLGVPLGTHWLSGPGLLSAHSAVFLTVFAVLAGLCWLSARLAQRSAPAAPASTGDASAEAVPGAAAAGVLTRLLPYVTVVIAVFAPLAAALYLLTTVAWTLGERRLFLRRTRLAEVAPVPGTGGGQGNRRWSASKVRLKEERGRLTLLLQDVARRAAGNLR